MLQVQRVEAFGKPAVDWGQEVASLGAFALVSPKAGEAHRGQQFPQFCALPLRNCECLMVPPLGGGSIAVARSKLPRDRCNSASKARSSFVSMISAASARCSIPSRGCPSTAHASASHRYCRGVPATAPVARTAVRPRLVARGLPVLPRESQDPIRVVLWPNPKITESHVPSRVPEVPRCAVAPRRCG